MLETSPSTTTQPSPLFSMLNSRKTKLPTTSLQEKPLRLSSLLIREHGLQLIPLKNSPFNLKEPLMPMNNCSTHQVVLFATLSMQLKLKETFILNKQSLNDIIKKKDIFHNLLNNKI